MPFSMYHQFIANPQSIQIKMKFFIILSIVVAAAIAQSSSDDFSQAKSYLDSAIDESSKASSGLKEAAKSTFQTGQLQNAIKKGIKLLSSIVDGFGKGLQQIESGDGDSESTVKALQYIHQNMEKVLQEFVPLDKDFQGTSIEPASKQAIKAMTTVDNTVQQAITQIQSGSNVVTTVTTVYRTIDEEFGKFLETVQAISS